MVATSTGNPHIAEIGIVPGHTYTVLSTHNLLIESQEQRLIKLRNPWGRREWLGRCGDGDAAFWGALKDEDRRSLQHMELKDDGIFIMPWEDFLHLFDLLSICKYS
jgi:calpain-15